MDTCPVCNNPLPPGAGSCPACGFKITGSTQEFRPISFGQPSATADETGAEPKAALTVIRGPLNLDTVYPLDDREMTIGRSPHCDIFLNDMTVSRTHAIVMPVGAEFAIKDDGSFNGVWVNNENVTQTVLHDGDAIQIGAFVLMYHR